MAEGLLRDRLGDRYDAFSAGTEATRVKPLAIEAMAQIGIDISGHRSKTVEEFFDQGIDYVVTVCDSARETCPYFPARVEVIHQPFDDPSDAVGSHEERLAAFSAARDKIDAWISSRFG